MTWDEVKELGPVYAIGGVDDETSRKIEEYLLDATPEQQSEIALWQEVAACLPGALHPITPPVYLREHLLERIAFEVASRADELMGEEAVASDEFIPVEQDEPSNVVTFTPAVRPEPSFLRWLPIAATILLAISSAYLFWQNNTLTSEKNSIASELNSARERINNFESYFTASTEWATMSGASGKTEASAKVVFNPEDKTMTIYVFGLPELPSDKDYQLWYISKNVPAPVSAAVFRTDSQGHVQRVDDQNRTSQDANRLVLTIPYEVASGLTTMAVTKEPKGGSPKPTSNILMSGNLKGAI